MLENIAEEITWVVFSREVSRKYFPEDVRANKEIEFLALKQGNMSVTEYAVKFEELAKFYPHYAAETAEFSKCVKLESGLRTEIKRAIGYKKIRKFPDLVNGYRIYEEDTKTHYKMVSEKRGKQQNRGKPYSAPADKGKLKSREGKKPSGGDASTGITCFKCGETGHRVSECMKDSRKCFKCGKEEHVAADYKREGITCYNCVEKGHISTQCQKPKKDHNGGKVFALEGVQTSSEDNLIRGTCFINSTP